MRSDEEISRGHAHRADARTRATATPHARVYDCMSFFFYFDIFCFHFLMGIFGCGSGRGGARPVSQCTRFAPRRADPPAATPPFPVFFFHDAGARRAGELDGGSLCFYFAEKCAAVQLILMDFFGFFLRPGGAQKRTGAGGGWTCWEGGGGARQAGDGQRGAREGEGGRRGRGRCGLAACGGAAARGWGRARGRARGEALAKKDVGALVAAAPERAGGRARAQPPAAASRGAPAAALLPRPRAA